MKATVTVYDPAGGVVLNRSTWHLPDDLPARLAADLPAWASAATDLKLPASVMCEVMDGAALEMRWVIEPCACLSCRLPAGLPPDLPFWLAPAPGPPRTAGGGGG